MKKVLLFSRQPLTRRPLHDWLGDAATDVVLVTPPRAVAGADDALARFLGHRLVDDYGSWSTELAAEAAARAHGVDLVASTSEDDVLRAARLRDRLGLPGQDFASATAYRDKVVMKRSARAAGLAVPAFSAIEDPIDLLDFIDAVGFPVVVKPRFGAGAVGVSVLRCEADLWRLIESGSRPDSPQLPGRWMAEEFVEGPFFHVDGIMQGGEVRHGWPSRYSSGVAECLRGGGAAFSSALLSPADPRAASLMEFTAAVVGALPATAHPTSFHLEAWIGADGRPILCEIACRAGGALVSTVYEKAFGVDLVREGLRGQCGLELSLGHQHAGPDIGHGWIVFLPGHGRFRPPAEPCPVPGVDLTLLMEADAMGNGRRHAGDHAAAATVSADAADQVTERFGELARWWDENAAWV